MTSKQNTHPALSGGIRKHRRGTFISAGIIISCATIVMSGVLASCGSMTGSSPYITVQTSSTASGTASTGSSVNISTGSSSTATSSPTTGTNGTLTLYWTTPNPTSPPYLTFPDSLLYNDNWLWVKVEANNTARIGFTEYAEEAINSIWSIILPEPGTVITRGYTFGFMQGEDTMDVNLTAPISGTVIQTNENVLSDYSLVNTSPYDAGWFIVVHMSNPAELNSLSTAAEYASWCPPCHCNS